MITNDGSNSAIQAGSGNDSITNNGSNSAINAGTGNDEITNSSSSVTIDAGDGDNSIYDRSYYNTDHIVTIKAGDGNNYVYINRFGHIKWSPYDEDEHDSIPASVMIYFGDGDNVISIGDALALVTIKTGDGNNEIYGQGIIRTGIGNDTILASGTIDAGAGNDFIDVYSDSFLDAGAGDDIIPTFREGSTVLGGTGADTVVIGKNVSTITLEDFNFNSDTLVWRHTLGAETFDTATSESGLLLFNDELTVVFSNISSPTAEFLNFNVRSGKFSKTVREMLISDSLEPESPTQSETLDSCSEIVLPTMSTNSGHYHLILRYALQ